ncbi:MAG: hypothetical protein R3F61_16265 [Myxococcota bacterium]
MMQRAMPVLAVEIALVIAAWILAPWSVVPLAAIGIFAGGWGSAHEDDDRARRVAIASRVALVNGLAVGLTWWPLGAADPTIAAYGVGVRGMLCAILSGAAGLAAFGLALVGLDARFIQRT